MYIDLMLIKKNLWLLLTNEVNLFIFSFLFLLPIIGPDKMMMMMMITQADQKKGETLSIISIWECYSDNVLNGLSCYENQESTMLCVCFFYYYW